jgi:hypothetical protein
LKLDLPRGRDFLGRLWRNVLYCHVFISIGEVAVGRLGEKRSSAGYREALRIRATERYGLEVGVLD